MGLQTTIDQLNGLGIVDLTPVSGMVGKVGDSIGMMKEKVDGAKTAWTSAQGAWKTARETFSGKMRDPSAMLGGAQKATGQLKTAIDQLNGLGIVDLTPVSGMVGQVGDSIGVMKEKVDGAKTAWTSAQGAWKTARETFSGKMRDPSAMLGGAQKATGQLKTAIDQLNGLGIVDLTPVSGMIGQVGDSIGLVKGKVDEARQVWSLGKVGLEAFGKTALGASMQTRALAMGGGLKSFGRILTGFAGRIIPMVVTGFRGLATAVMANPIGAIIGGIAIAAALIFKYWKPLGKFFKGLFAGLMKSAKKVLGWLMPKVAAVGKVFKGIGKLFGFGKEKEDGKEDGLSETAKPGDVIGKQKGGNGGLTPGGMEPTPLAGNVAPEAVPIAGVAVSASVAAAEAAGASPWGP